MSERVELVWYGDDAPPYDHGPEHPLRPARVELTRRLIHDEGLIDGPQFLSLLLECGCAFQFTHAPVQRRHLDPGLKHVTLDLN